MSTDLTILIAEHLGVPTERVVPHASLVDDLEADSLDLVDLVLRLEETYDVSFGEHDWKEFRLVSDVSRMVESLRGAH